MPFVFNLGLLISWTLLVYYISYNRAKNTAQPTKKLMHRGINYRIDTSIEWSKDHIPQIIVSTTLPRSMRGTVARVYLDGRPIHINPPIPHRISSNEQDIARF